MPDTGRRDEHDATARQRTEFTVDEEAANQRLDQFLSAQLYGVSRARVQLLLEQHKLALALPDGSAVPAEKLKPNYRLRGGEHLRLLGAPELGEDARFATNSDRVGNRTELEAALAPRIALRRRDEFLAALAASGIPGGPINDVAQVFADPQVIARGMRIDPGSVPAIASPIVIDGRRQVSDRPSPALPERSTPTA